MFWLKRMADSKPCIRFFAFAPTRMRRLMAFDAGNRNEPMASTIVSWFGWEFRLLTGT